MKRILALLTVFAMLFSFAACKNNEETAEPAEPGDIAMQSENFSFNLAEATYIFNRCYIEYYNENYQYMSYYGIDRTKSLKEQYYTESNGTTWFDYFLDEAEAYMNEILLFCEASKAEGNSLDEEDTEEIDSIVQEFYDEALGNGYEINEFVQNMYGGIVTINDVRSTLEKEKLAFKYYNALLDSFTYTEEQEDAYLSENPDEFYYVNYVSYTFDENNDRDAKYNARELKETADADAFYAYIEDYETNVLKLEEDKKEGANVVNYHTSDGEAVDEWAFAAKTGDKYINEDGAKGVYTVYMLTGEKALQEYTTRDIRFICLTKATYETNEAAKTKAQDILAKWEENGKTPEAFGELAKKYSEDENSADYGGVYQYVDKTNSILEDEGIAWLFDEAAIGDAKVFKGEDIYYVVYYEAEGKAQWRTAADDAMAEADYYEVANSINADHTATPVDEVLQQIDE